MFKRPATHYGKSPQPETPYQRAAQVWDDRIGSARVQARNWRFMAFGSLALSMGLAAAPPFTNGHSQNGRPALSNACSTQINRNHRNNPPPWLSQGFMAGSRHPNKEDQ